MGRGGVSAGCEDCERLVSAEDACIGFEADKEGKEEEEREEGCMCRVVRTG